VKHQRISREVNEISWYGQEMSVEVQRIPEKARKSPGKPRGSPWGPRKSLRGLGLAYDGGWPITGENVLGSPENLLGSQGNLLGSPENLLGSLENPWQGEGSLWLRIGSQRQARHQRKTRVSRKVPETSMED
jgi:hypothetical protein